MNQTMASVILSMVCIATLYSQPAPPIDRIALFSISGTITDDPFPSKRMSLPIHGATIYLQAPSTGIVPMPYEPLDPVTTGIMLPQPYYHIIDSAISTATGAFTFARQPTGSYRLEVSHAGYSPRTLDISLTLDTSVTVMLLADGATGSVSGVISQDMGMLAVFVPIKGCTVTVNTITDIYPIYLNTQASMPVFIPLYRGVTDSTGRYTISNIPLSQNKQQVSVTAYKPGFLTKTATATISNMTTTPVSMSLLPAYPNAGSVTVGAITYTMSTNKKAYSPGDTVKVRYSLYNGSADTFDFEGGICNRNWQVQTTGGKTLYDYLDQRMCPMMYVFAQLAPGEAIDYSFADDTFTVPKGYDSLIVRGQMAGRDSTRVTMGIKINRTAISAPAIRQLTPVSTVSYSPRDQRLTISLDHGQYVNVEAYLLNGEKVRQLSARRFLTAGSHAYSLKGKQANTGIAIIRIKGENFSATRKIELVHH